MDFSGLTFGDEQGRECMSYIEVDIWNVTDDFGAYNKLLGGSGSVKAEHVGCEICKSEIEP
jgi:hypothetical protein